VAAELQGDLQIGIEQLAQTWKKHSLNSKDGIFSMHEKYNELHSNNK